MANGFAALPWLRRRVKQNIPASILVFHYDTRSSTVVLYGLFFFSGWSALVYEISWNRQIGIALGHTATSSAVVLGAYFTGLSLGSWFGGRVADRFAPGRGYAVCELVAASVGNSDPTFCTNNWIHPLHAGGKLSTSRYAWRMLGLYPAVITCHNCTRRYAAIYKSMAQMWSARTNVGIETISCLRI